MAWVTLERPGYFGKKKEEIFKEYDTQFGKDEWRIMWRWEKNVVGFYTACFIYEDAYFYDSFRRPEVWKELIATACEVYDIEEKDVKSGLDYLVQNSAATHVQDVAIRRVMKRRGWRFEGKELVRIRHHDTYWGGLLSPDKVPFHLPDRIVTPHLAGWWDFDSVEDFYQSNKVVQVRK